MRVTFGFAKNGVTENALPKEAVDNNYAVEMFIHFYSLNLCMNMYTSILGYVDANK